MPLAKWAGLGFKSPMHTNWPYFLIAYLLGALPSGLLIARIKGVDLRSVGSGNIGATNVFRMVGKSWGLLTLLLDALKGFVPAFFFPRWADQPGAVFALLCGCAAIAGHNWPVYLRFKGGKGVATSAGVLLGVVPGIAAIGLATFALVFALTRYVSVGSMAAAAAIVIWAWVNREPETLVLSLVLTALGALVFYTHRSNLRRLLRGQEIKIVFGKAKASCDDQQLDDDRDRKDRGTA